LLSSRKQILQWAEHGHLSEGSLPAALKLADAEPSTTDWQHFIDQLLLWFGAIFMAVGVIFFFAYNWQEMGRFAKFGLVEFCLVATVAISWKTGLERMSGKAALFAATLLLGALLALVGQTYQTGADPWQLFATWAVMLLPWVAIGRFSALLLFWVALVNVSLILYFQTFPRFFGLIGLLFSAENLIWALFIFNTVVLCLWELAAQRQKGWLNERWSLRVLNTASGGLVTTLVIWTIFDDRSYSLLSLLAYGVWLAAAYFIYRCKFQDIFVLAGGVFSVIIVVTTWLANQLLSRGDSAGGLLFIGMTVIGLSALGGLWLKSVAQEGRA
jgi:uncharacterized membrane protein